jgi:NAD(P)-dependent dehydrogenase (short-subunit alcohol dehydrogenase family)
LGDSSLDFGSVIGLSIDIFAGFSRQVLTPFEAQGVLMVANLFDLSGRLALISGSSRGIGFAIARALASAGASVVLNGRNPAPLEAAAQDLRRTGAVVSIAPFDVTDAGQAAKAVESVERSIGAIDILVNNAGMQYRSSLENYPVEKWDELLRTNLNSVFLLSRAVAPYMIARGGEKSSISARFRANWRGPPSRPTRHPKVP